MKILINGHYVLQAILTLNVFNTANSQLLIGVFFLYDWYITADTNDPNIITTDACTLLSLRIEVALVHIPYTVEFINRKITNRIDF